jgi:thiamine pyrophosphate-dependent acetolactate synthase large subunit-like protein
MQSVATHWRKNRKQNGTVIRFQHPAFDHRVALNKCRRNFDTTSGILGWGIAAAIGTKIGNPKKETWRLTGDGCFNFGSQALWSAARYEVPIGIVIFNNGQYQANRATQIRVGGKRIQKSGHFMGVNLGHPDIDYVSMSASYGIEGERVSDPRKLAGALKRCRRAMHEGRPYVVDVIIARRFEGKESDYYDFVSISKMQNA